MSSSLMPRPQADTKLSALSLNPRSLDALRRGISVCRALRIRFRTPPGATNILSHACTHTHMSHIHKYATSFTHQHTRRIRSYVHIYTRTRTYTRTHTYTHTHAHTHTDIRTRTYTHTHIHTHIRTRTRAHARAPSPRHEATLLHLTARPPAVRLLLFLVVVPRPCLARALPVPHPYLSGSPLAQH